MTHHRSLCSRRLASVVKRNYRTLNTIIMPLWNKRHARKCHQYCAHDKLLGGSVTNPT
jgi:hypothetical protein